MDLTLTPQKGGVVRGRRCKRVTPPEGGAVRGRKFEVLKFSSYSTYLLYPAWLQAEHKTAPPNSIEKKLIWSDGLCLI